MTLVRAVQATLETLCVTPAHTLSFADGRVATLGHLMVDSALLSPIRAMLKNIFTTAYRNIFKHKAASLINLFGLSIALGVALVVFQFMYTNFTMDRFHTDVDRIFYVEHLMDREGTMQRWGTTPHPLGPTIKAELPQVEEVVRFAYGNGNFRYRDNVFNQWFTYVDPTFFDLFDLKLRLGSPTALQNPQSIILSDVTATKYFGDANPLGETLTVVFGTRQEVFTVDGVLAPYPNNTKLNFAAFINYQKQADLGVENLESDWSGMASATFVRLRDVQDAETLPTDMARYLDRQHADNEGWQIAGFKLTPLTRVALESRSIQNNFVGGPHPAAIIVLGLIGLFLMLLACFNYMNISIATASQRLREIGVRKVMGSSRAQLIAQFLGENLLLCALALLLGVVVGKFGFAPAFNSLFDVHPGIDISLTGSWILWGFLGAMLGLTALVAGAYPAFYVSALDTTTIFRGRTQLKGGRWFSRVFLGFQFVLAFFTMAGALIMVQNGQYQVERDWGYNQAHTLVIPLDDGAQFGPLRDDIQNIASVTAVAGSRQHIARWTAQTIVDVRGERLQVARFDVGFGYLETLGIRLRTGRFFSEEFQADLGSHIVVNELFAERYGWTPEEAINQVVRFDEATYTIVGVAEHFVFRSPDEPMQPALFRATEADNFSFLVARTQPGTSMQTAETLEDVWKIHFPDAPYRGYFQETAFDAFYRDNRNVNGLFGFTAFMALLLSCMGLFGLASQHTAQRMKEIGIRKVLGASVASVTRLVNRGFVVLILVAALVATPASYFMMNMLLDAVFAYRITISSTPFLLTYALVLITALATISSQIYKVAQASPVHLLRDE